MNGKPPQPGTVWLHPVGIPPQPEHLGPCRALDDEDNPCTTPATVAVFGAGDCGHPVFTDCGHIDVIPLCLPDALLNLGEPITDDRACTCGAVSAVTLYPLDVADWLGRWS